MEFSTLEKEYNHFYAPAFSIIVDGEDLLKQYVEVFGVTVNNTLEGADDFSFTVNNPFDVKAGEFKYIQNHLLDVNNKVEVKIGYGSNLKSIMQGLITSVDLSFPANGVSQLTVKGYNNLHLMMKNKNNHNWGRDDQPGKFSDIAKELAGKYGLETKSENVVDTKEKPHQIKQHEESDYDFLKKKIAEKIGYELFVFLNDFFFRPPADNKNENITTLEWGKSLISFSPTLNTADQVSEIQVRGWDPNKQEAIVGKARKGDEHGRDSNRQSGGELVKESIRYFWKPGVNSKEGAEKIAKSILNKLSEGFVKGNGESIGLPDILPGKNIELAGLGQKFSKTYYIEKVTHSISTSGYKTTFSIKERTI